MSMHGLGQPKAVIRLMGWTLDQWAIAEAELGSWCRNTPGTDRAVALKEYWSHRFCHEPGVGMVRWDDPEPNYEAAHKLFDMVLKEVYTIRYEGGDDHVQPNNPTGPSGSWRVRD